MTQTAKEESTGSLLLDPQSLAKEVQQLTKQMRAAAAELDFEKAADLRDEIKQLKEKYTSLYFSTLPLQGEKR